MEITIYCRQSADCPDKADRYAPRCGCPLWGEFNWTQPQTALDGKKLRQGQNKWTLKTRTKAEALRHAAKLENPEWQWSQLHIPKRKHRSRM